MSRMENVKVSLIADHQAIERLLWISRYPAILAEFGFYAHTIKAVVQMANRDMTVFVPVM